MNATILLTKIDSWGLSDQKICKDISSWMVHFVAFTVIISILGVSFDNKPFLIIWTLLWLGLAFKHIIFKDISQFREDTKELGNNE